VDFFLQTKIIKERSTTKQSVGGSGGRNNCKNFGKTQELWQSLSVY